MDAKKNATAQPCLLEACKTSLASAYILVDSASKDFSDFIHKETKKSPAQVQEMTKRQVLQISTLFPIINIAEQTSSQRYNHRDSRNGENCTCNATRRILFLFTEASQHWGHGQANSMS